MKNKKLLYFAIAFFLFAIIFAVGFQFLNKKNNSGEKSLINSVFQNIFPFKTPLGGEDVGFTEDLTVGELVDGPQIEERPTLFKITPLPVSGATLLDSTRERITYQETASGSVPVTEFYTSRLIRYAEKSSGHIYEVPLDDFVKSKITGTTIPGTEEVLFDKTGNYAVFRYFDETSSQIKSFGGQIPTSSGQIGRVIGDYLDDNILSISFSPNTNQILFSKEDGVYTNIFTSDFNGKNKKQIFSSPFSEWLLDWPNEKNFVLNTKPSGYFAGFVYQVDTKTSTLEKISGNISGVTYKEGVLGDKGLLGSAQKDTLNLYLLNKETSGVTNLGIGTLPEKCVFSKNTFVYCFVPNFIPKAIYPDDWYKGVVSFSDSLWVINTGGRVANRIIDISDLAGEGIDGVNPVLSTDGEDLLFINKKDLSLWLYDL